MHWGLQMTDQTKEMEQLDACFLAAREMTPTPSDALLARISADSTSVQPVPRSAMQSRPAAKVGWVRDVLQAIGGWPAFGGLTTAALAGVWLGINPPVSMAVAAENYLGLDGTAYLIDFAPGAEFDLSLETQ